MTTTTAVTGQGGQVLDLRPLDPEPWGAKMTRARDRAGFTLQAVAELLPGQMSRTTLNRLEKRSTVPDAPKDRQRAVMACLIYHVDPASLGLSLTDLPSWVDAQMLTEMTPLNIA